MYSCAPHACSARRPEEGISSLGAGLTDSWELNLSPLVKQLLTIKPISNPQKFLFLCFCFWCVCVTEREKETDRQAGRQRDLVSLCSPGRTLLVVQASLNLRKIHCLCLGSAGLRGLRCHHHRLLYFSRQDLLLKLELARSSRCSQAAFPRDLPLKCWGSKHPTNLLSFIGGSRLPELWSLGLHSRTFHTAPSPQPPWKTC